MHKAFEVLHDLPDDTPLWRKSTEVALNAGTVVAAVIVGRWGVNVAREMFSHVMQPRAALEEKHLEQEQVVSQSLAAETAAEYIGESLVAHRAVLNTAVDNEVKTEETVHDR